jgi:hypothetical protein
MLIDGILLDSILRELHPSKTYTSRISMKIALQGIDCLLLNYFSEAKQAEICKLQIGLDLIPITFEFTY